MANRLDIITVRVEDERAVIVGITVPDEIAFRTSPRGVQEQITSAVAPGMPMGVVLAEAAFGNNRRFREDLKRSNCGAH
jgi:SRSO17 transposase